MQVSVKVSVKTERRTSIPRLLWAAVRHAETEIPQYPCYATPTAICFFKIIFFQFHSNLFCPRLTANKCSLNIIYIKVLNVSFLKKKRGKDIPITRNSIRSTVNFKMFFFFLFPQKPSELSALVLSGPGAVSWPELTALWSGLQSPSGQGLMSSSNPSGRSGMGWWVSTTGGVEFGWDG